MKVSLKDLRGKEIESLELPSVFNTPFRPEIIKKVYVMSFQPNSSLREDILQLEKLSVQNLAILAWELRE